MNNDCDTTVVSKGLIHISKKSILVKQVKKDINSFNPNI